MNVEAELAALKAQVAALEKETRAARDQLAIQNLQTAYGYYVDKAQWDQAADLFAADATLEINHRGLFIGQDRVRGYLKKLGKLEYGFLFNHMQLQPHITVAEDGKTANGRWRAIMQVGILGQRSMHGEATYENAYVKEDGVWKIKKLHAFTTYYIPFDKGWEHGGLPKVGPLADYPPDAPTTHDYLPYPDVYIPPYHYKNPVTGR
jgi:hypothetical protein